MRFFGVVLREGAFVHISTILKVLRSLFLAFFGSFRLNKLLLVRFFEVRINIILDFGSKSFALDWLYLFLPVRFTGEDGLILILGRHLVWLQRDTIRIGIGGTSTLWSPVSAA